MAINSNVMPHDLIRDVGSRKLCIYAIMKLFVVSWGQNCEKVP